MTTTYRQFMVAIISLCTTAMIRTTVVRPEAIPTLAPIVVTQPARVRPAVRGDVEAFMYAIGHVESGHQIGIVNQNDCIGKYQFCPSTFRFLKERQLIDTSITREQFLADETLQDIAMIALMRYNYKQLRSLIRIYNGRWYNDIYVTTSGLLAAAHLVGVGGVNAYFYPDSAQYARFVIQDANGVTAADRLKRFANYRISL